jgi:branched-chain amino acid transport system substrate-binding protein
MDQDRGLTRRVVLRQAPLALAAGAAMLGKPRPGAAQAGHGGISDGVVKIGVLTDMNGPYRDFCGAGSVTAARMAVEEFGGTVLDKPVEVVFADHQNKPDIGSAIAREWFSQGKVDMITDMPNSAVGLAVQDLAREAKRITMNAASASTDLVGKFCSPTGVHWTADGYASAHGTAASMVKRGDDSWFFITVNYTGGYAVEDAASAAVKAGGGKVLGGVRFPPNTTDFSSYLLQAQSSGAKVVAFAVGGNDAINGIKQAAEFGLTRNGQKVAALFLTIADVHSLGLGAVGGIVFTDGFYWDYDARTRDFSKRFFARQNAMPTLYQAGVASAVGYYLKSIQACGTDDALMVMEQMRSQPIDDFFTRNGRLRKDGRMVHDMYLCEAKMPAQSKSEWDLYNVLNTIPGDQAFRSMAEGGCSLV